MKTIAPHDWQKLNQRYLAAALFDVQATLQQYVARLQGKEVTESESRQETEDLEAVAEGAASPNVGELPFPPALETLREGFNLTPFEREVLLLSAGVELSGTLANLCATAQGNSQMTYPTFSLMLAAFPDADWSALAPIAPLRHWRLIELGGKESLTQSRLRIDEQVLHYLTGVPYLDERLQGLLEPLPFPRELPPSYRLLAQRMTRFWQQGTDDSSWSIIQLLEEQGAGSRVAADIAASACADLGIQLQSIQAADIPQTVPEREALARLWEREAILNHGALLVDCEDLNGKEQMRAVISFIETVETLLIVVGREPLRIRSRPVVRLEVNPLSTAEQLNLWQQALEPLASEFNGQLEGLVSQFHLTPQTIQEVCWQLKIKQENFNSKDEAAANSHSLPSPDLLFDSLWDICRVQSQPQLAELAQRIKAIATWKDLVLPDIERQQLTEIAAQVKQRVQVYDTWEYAVRGANGLGISALFAGASGTGKTLAAEVLAHELNLDLYRIDLSQVVSKYIGETEKNLRQVFEAAEAGGAILLFDEADALFGKRSEVRDSHDRYANIEVSYLLQRMEAYRGLAILTTNLKSAIDSAFLRRIRFVVQFPFPDVAQRTEIWRRMFPPKLPTEGLDFPKLARLNVAGGNIRNIALNGAFLAADAGESLRMAHLLRAARSEYAKLEKSLTEAEVGGWI